jgi:hypothetical protein
VLTPAASVDMPADHFHVHVVSSCGKRTVRWLIVHKEAQLAGIKPVLLLGDTFALGANVAQERECVFPHGVVTSRHKVPGSVLTPAASVDMPADHFHVHVACPTVMPLKET